MSFVARLLGLLTDLKTFADGGKFPDDAIREALTVCENKDDVPEYLEQYMARHHTVFASTDVEGV